MEPYFDTSALIGLYVPEARTAGMVEYVASRGVSLAIHGLHELQLENGLRAKVFRKEMARAQCRKILERIGSDIRDGLLVHRPLSWPDVFRTAREMTADATERLGCRSLDLLHIAAAIAWRVSVFVSVDERQLRAARAAGLRILDGRTL